MSLALDYTGRLTPAELKAAGVTDVMRYLSWLHRWGGIDNHPDVNPKIILPDEYAMLINGGINVTLNWEYDTYDWLGGADNAHAHAAEAIRQAQAMPYPYNCTIIGSADFDMTRAQWDANGKAYAVAWEHDIASAGYEVGAYGSIDVLQWCREEVNIPVLWQAGMSTAWCQGRNAQRSPYASLRQLRHQTISGEDTDINEILMPYWGQAQGKTQPQGTDPMLTHWQSCQRGDKGDHVKKAQGVLIANGLSVGSPNGLPDGDFGPTTEASTMTLQSRYGITRDGIFGPHSLSVGLYGADFV